MVLKHDIPIMSMILNYYISANGSKVFTRELTKVRSFKFIDPNVIPYVIKTLDIMEDVLMVSQKINAIFFQSTKRGFCAKMCGDHGISFDKISAIIHDVNKKSELC